MILDSRFMLLMLLATGIGAFAQYKVQSTFKKHSTVPTMAQRTGSDVANMMINSGSEQTPVHAVQGTLTDHFDPSKNVVNLSEPVFGSTSISAVAVAAHECGHVKQYRDGYIPMKLRSSIVPIANIGTSVSWPLFLVGMMSGMVGLMKIGIILFAAGVLFHLVTLPVELNASRRALNSLKNDGYLQPSELAAAKSVLSAAAMTYIAAALASIVTLLQYVMIANSRSNRK